MPYPYLFGPCRSATARTGRPRRDRAKIAAGRRANRARRG